MNDKEIVSYSANIMGGVFTALQTDEVLRYVQLVLTIIATLFSIAFTIYNWYKKAKKDGKITKDEVEDLIDQLNGKDNDENEKL